MGGAVHVPGTPGPADRRHRGDYDLDPLHDAFHQCRALRVPRHRTGSERAGAQSGGRGRGSHHPGRARRRDRRGTRRDARRDRRCGAQNYRPDRPHRLGSHTHAAPDRSQRYPDRAGGLERRGRGGRGPDL